MLKCIRDPTRGTDAFKDVTTKVNKPSFIKINRFRFKHNELNSNALQQEELVQK